MVVSCTTDNTVMAVKIITVSEIIVIITIVCVYVGFIIHYSVVSVE
jgi:hypothetical protein